MALPQRYQIEQDIVKNPLFSEKLTTALEQKTAKNKGKQIETSRQCAEETHTVLRLFFGDQDVVGFTDSEKDYRGVIWDKLERIYDYLKDCTLEDVSSIYQNFGVSNIHSDSLSLAIEVKNLVEQGDTLGVIRQFLIPFGGNYSIEISGHKTNGNIFDTFLGQTHRKGFYIDNWSEFLGEVSLDKETVNYSSALKEKTPDTIREQTTRETGILISLISVKELRILIQTELRVLEDRLQNIHPISELLDFISCTNRVTLIRGRMQRLAGDIMKINLFLNDDSLAEKQVKSSQNDRASKQEEFNKLEKELDALIIRIQNNIYKKLPTYDELYNKVRLHLGKTEEKPGITPQIEQSFVKNELLTIFLQALNPKGKDIQAETYLGLLEIIELKIILESGESIASNTRRKFTEKYINQFFRNLYSTYPALNSI